MTSLKHPYTGHSLRGGLWKLTTEVRCVLLLILEELDFPTLIEFAIEKPTQNNKREASFTVCVVTQIWI